MSAGRDASAYMVAARVLTVHRLEAGDWRIIGAYGVESAARIAPFDAVPLSVVDWWPPAVR